MDLRGISRQQEESTERQITRRFTICNVPLLTESSKLSTHSTPTGSKKFIHIFSCKPSLTEDKYAAPRREWRNNIIIDFTDTGFKNVKRPELNFHVLCKSSVCTYCSKKTLPKGGLLRTDNAETRNPQIRILFVNKTNPKCPCRPYVFISA